MTQAEIYEMLLELINKKAESSHITQQQLLEYYKPEGLLLSQNYLHRLASSLQNSGMMHNSIRFNESQERYEHIKEVLFDFNCEKSVQKYNNWFDLYNALTKGGTFDNGVQKESEEKRTNWGKYAKGLFDGIVFLANENGMNKIDELCKAPLDTKEFKEKIKELKTIEKRVHGLGFALTCDWLKECGCTWLAKPDINIKVVCSAILGKDSTEQISDIETIEIMFDLANVIKKDDPAITPYMLDKMIWLICTGNFYLQKDKIGRDTILSRLSQN